ncbi:hypothetical protein [Ornithinimicrobium murale]|uniref:hypothetical protein n=1 Tax=Ornithinimicrobium murale TaxID=1050153 RepID=UPI0013B365AF|nr:hypothetical protein [Ornithinimicrobium murale]
MDSITASGRHEAQLIERIESAMYQLSAAEEGVRAARERRDTAVRAAVRAGAPVAAIAKAASVSEAMVSRLAN